MHNLFLSILLKSFFHVFHFFLFCHLLFWLPLTFLQQWFTTVIAEFVEEKVKI